MEALFGSNKGVRGEMLAKVIDAICDFLGPRTYANYMVQCEVVTHFWKNADADLPPLQDAKREYAQLPAA